MKELIHEGIESLTPYPPGKPIEELERELGISGIIKLASNENPLGPSPLAIKAIMEKLHTLHRYPDGSGYHLKLKLSEKYDLPVDQIILGNGSNELIELIVRTFLSPGEQAIQAFPTFLVYEKVVRGAGGQVVSVPLSDFRIDPGGILRRINQKTKIVFMDNPNNPTGSFLSKQELASFLSEIPKHIIVVLDEAYIEFVTRQGSHGGIDLLMQYPMLVRLRTFSKVYGLAGLRVGYGFASEKIIDYLNRVRQPFNINRLAQVAATAAIEDFEFVAETLRLVREGLSCLYQELDDIGLEYIPTQSNFFLIRVPYGGKKTYELMLRQGVIVRSMDSYGLPEYIRINPGLPEENKRFVKALKKVLGVS